MEESKKTIMNHEKAFEDLLDIKDVFNKVGIKFWLLWGTLIGAIRENDFMPHDHDIDLGMYFEDTDKCVLILEKLREKGFNCATTAIKTNSGTKYFSLKLRRNESIDILSFIGMEKKRIYVHGIGEDKLKIWLNDPKYFENLKVIRFRGEEFYVPMDVEEALTLWYGNWKKKGGQIFSQGGIPLKEVDKKEFLEKIINS